MRIKVSADPLIKQIASAAYPEYRGRKFHIEVSEYPLDVRSYWDGGSRSYFRFVNLMTLEISSQVSAQSAFDKPISGAEAVTLPVGFACVEHSIFCGKDSGLTFHIRPENAAKLLPVGVQS